jgi:hypothetical protein
MDVQKLTHEVRLQQWGRTVKDCRNSGKSVKSWCAENNINIKTYYYWQRKVCQSTCRELVMNHPQPTLAITPTPTAVFAELCKPNPPSGQLALTIQHKHMEIQIYRGADAAIVETALLAIRNLC